MRLRYTITALRQIEQVLDYVEARSPQGARHIRDRIRTALALVEEYPFVAQATSRPGVHRIVMTPYPYVIFYRVMADEIVVMRFRHAFRRP